MAFVTPNYWKPSQAYRPCPAPVYGELVDFLDALKPKASRSTYDMFLALARLPPAERAAEALQTVIALLHRNPHLIENRDNTEVFARVLTTEEYASFMEIAGLPGLTQVNRRTAEGLLCLQDRGTLVYFLSKTFAALANQPHYIHPLEYV